MNENRKPFSSQIKVLIDEFGVTGIANLIDVSDTIVRNWRKGKSEPGLKNLLALSDSTGVSLDWLSTGLEDMKPSADKSEIDACEKAAYSGSTKPMSYDESIQLVGENLKRSRQLYESAIELAGYEPAPVVGEYLKSLIFDTFICEAADVKTITRLLEAMRDAETVDKE